MSLNASGDFTLHFEPRPEDRWESIHIRMAEDKLRLRLIVGEKAESARTARFDWSIDEALYYQLKNLATILEATLEWKDNCIEIEGFDGTFRGPRPCFLVATSFGRILIVKRRLASLPVHIVWMLDKRSEGKSKSAYSSRNYVFECSHDDAVTLGNLVAALLPRLQTRISELEAETH